MSANGANTAHISPSPLEPDFARLYDIGDATFVLNLIVDVDGGFAPPGASKELTNSRDRQLFHHLRTQCDLILIGGGTARTEPYRSHTHQVAVLTRSGNLPDDFYTGVKPWVLTDSTSFARVTHNVQDRAKIHLLENVTDLVAFTAQQGIHSVLCEGGGNLALQLAHANLFDLIFLTRVPHRSKSTQLDIAQLIRGVPLSEEIVEAQVAYQRHQKGEQ